MLNFRPQGGNDLTRVIAAAYQAHLTPGAQISNTTPEVSPGTAAAVVSTVQASRRPLTGRQVQLATGYRGERSTVQDKIRQWEQMRAEMQQQEPPAWLQAPKPPAWLTVRRHNR